MKQTLFFLLLLSINASKAQNTYTTTMDSLVVQTDIFKESERLLNNFKSSFNEKDSLMVTEFEKKYKEYLEVLNMAEHTGRQNRLAKELEIEQKRIMAFEESIIKADSVLKLETRAWIRDFIKSKIRFYEKENNVKIAFVEQITNEGDRKDLIEIINFINNSNWKTDFEYQFNFIKSKILFDFKLE